MCNTVRILRLQWSRDCDTKDFNELDVDAERALSAPLVVLPLSHLGDGGGDSGSLLNEEAGRMVVEMELTALDTYATYSSRQRKYREPLEPPLTSGRRVVTATYVLGGMVMLSRAKPFGRKLVGGAQNASVDASRWKDVNSAEGTNGHVVAEEIRVEETIVVKGKPSPLKKLLVGTQSSNPHF
ncbi:PhoD-like phosphatase [Colletotrichum acutatum]